jgi:deoxycytidylate deaminase
MLLINCGIKRVVCERRYHSAEDSIKMMAAAGVALVHLSDEIQSYEKQPATTLQKKRKQTSSSSSSSSTSDEEPAEKKAKK